MHENQEKLLELSKKHDLGKMTYREMAELIGLKNPDKNAQTMKYHLEQLEKRNLVHIDRENKVIRRIKSGVSKLSSLIAIPVYGSADCGSATKLAENYVQKHIRVSKNLVPYKKGIFAVQADGFSMNQAKIGSAKRNIEPGDYVIVDGDVKTPENGEYVLSVIDGFISQSGYLH